MTKVILAIVTFAASCGVASLLTIEPSCLDEHSRPSRVKAAEASMKPNLPIILIASLAITLSLSSAAQAQAVPSPAASAASSPLPQAFQRLNLSPTQQQQILQIRQNARDQLMQQLLNDGQRQQLKSALKSGKSMREAIAAISLPASTRNQVRALYRSAYEQMAGILTEQQKTQLQQNRQTGQPPAETPTGQ